MLHFISTMNIRETLFTTNQAPSAVETLAIDVALAELRAEQNSSATPDDRLSDIAAMIVRLEAIRHPMRSIPDDILGLIFAYAMPWCLVYGISKDAFPPEDFRPDDYDAANTRKPPWTLSQVCQNWRALALSLPRLWSTWSLTPSYYHNDAIQSGRRMIDWGIEYARRMETIFQRSGPLSLDFVDGLPDSEAILSTLLATTDRWCCIRISYEYGGARLKPMLHNRPLPLLTHLLLYLARPSGTTILAPCLQNLELIGAYDGDLVLPWEQIKRYRSIRSSFKLLERMQNLEELVVEDELYEDKIPLTIFPKVTRIERHNRDGGSYLDIPALCFSFPSLYTLVIIEHRISTPLPYTNDFSLPSVNELSLSFEKAEDVSNILRATPNVQSLHVDSEDGQAALVHSASPDRPSATACLKQLKNLSLTLRDTNRLKDLKAKNFTALNKALAALRLYDVPLETLSFYSGVDDGFVCERPGFMCTEGQWISRIQEKMADALLGWEGELQVLYYHNETHVF